MQKTNTNGTMTQQMRIRYYVMNLIYRNSGKSVKVPSTRELSKQFGIARSTVQLAFEKLLQEGYLVSRQGAATMTNPRCSFVLQPQTRNPLIGVKLYEGDAFYYGANFWRIISSVATELTERNFNIRLLMNAATTRESINREIQESYLDGVILIDSSTEYIDAARTQLPCVAIGNAPRTGLPAYIRRSEEKAIRQLAGLLRSQNRTRALDIVTGITGGDEFQTRKQLVQLNPSLQFESFNISASSDPLAGLRERITGNPPDMILHYEQYAESLQRIADESGRDILLVSRKPPAREVYYNGCFFEFPLDRIGRTAVDMLESLLAGEKELPVQLIEAELNTRMNQSQERNPICTVAGLQ